MDDLGDFSSDVLTAAASGKPAPVYTGKFVGDPSAVMQGISEMKDPVERAHAMAAFNEQAARTPGFAQGKPFQKADDLADFSSSALTQAAKGVSAPPPAQSNGLHPVANSQQIVSPEADLTAHAVSGLVAPVVGGIAGIASGVKNAIQSGSIDKGLEAGAETVKNTTNALTYQPRTEIGRDLSNAYDSKYNPLGWIPSATQWAGTKLGDLLTDAGAPGAGAVVKGIGAAAPAAIGLARPISGLVKPGEAPEVPRIEPTMNGPVAGPKPRYRLENGEPVLVPQQLPQGAPVPAAATSPAATSASARPTIAQASPEIQQVVKQAQEKNAPVNDAAVARHVDADTLPVKVQLTEGQALMDPEKISMEMNQRGKTGAPVPPQFYNEQGKALASNMDAIRSKVAPDIAASNPTEIGQLLVDEYKKMDAPVVADINAKYQALRDANGGDFPVDASALRNNINAALKKELLTHDAPASQMAEINSLADEGGMTFEHFLSLRRNLGNIARTSTDGNTRNAASIMVQQLEDLPLEPGAANLKPLADAARSAARARFQRMEADPAYKAAAGDSVGVGEPSPLADKFVQGYIINGKAANVKQMKANLGGSPTANQAIAAAGVDYLTGMAKADKNSGSFLADRYNTGLRQLGPKLNDVLGQEAAQTAQQVGRVARYTSVQPKGSYVNNSNSTVSYLADKAKDVAEGVVNVKSGGIPLGTLGRKVMENRAAKKAAERATAPGAGITSP